MAQGLSYEQLIGLSKCVCDWARYLTYTILLLAGVTQVSPGINRVITPITESRAHSGIYKVR